MNKARDRRIKARENRQESLHNRGKVIVEKTVAKVPQPKSFPTKETVKVKEKIISKKASVNSPKITGIEKRGRGRPPKSVTDNNKQIKSGTIKANKLNGSKGKK